MTPVLDSHKTLVDGLKLAFEMTLRSPEGIAAPAALIWADAEKEWQPLIPILRSAIPQLYVLGEYDPESKTGPVIWLKCIVDRVLKGVSPDADLTPILYLPGIDRQILRAGADCPPSLQPLVELQYRGAVWHQRDGRDWTVGAFLSTDAGLGLDLAQDMWTKEALMRALP
ncbi:MAG: BREX-1 system phosphatase PglZ type B, partial [Deltaproteobacteria bacterium]